VQLLAGGLTQGVQGFSALPNVGNELDSISKEFPSQTIRDEAFVIDEVQRQIANGDQAIVHIATHGQFDSDHTKSFLLAYDDKLTMDKLQSTIASRQFQQEPLELLVLSACQTAAGDDRAALGLAGVALNAGARSALATLWFVNDESTSRMITDFYRQLSTSTSSKAEALRQAQLALIRDQRFAHPSFWAPFLLIGNWL
jgi:CHAT domain-containing protein